MSEADFGAAADRQSRILSLLSRQAVGYDIGYSESREWYEVVLHGFNVVDEKCDFYISNLFRLDRQRNRIARSMTLIDKTTEAILTVADLERATITVVSQAFGFAAGITDIVASSYLFSIAPALIQKNVDDAHNIYRTQTETDRNVILTRAIAYARIRNYLALCFPQSIDARIQQTLAETGAGVKGRTGGATGSASRALPLRSSTSAVPPQIVPLPMR